jgi:transcriptional regulator with XRE-family HTH domain
MVRRPLRGSENDDPAAWQGTDAGRQALETDAERRAWAIIGRRLYLGRKQFRISKREAARRAGISEALWRQLEGGGEMLETGSFVPNPRDENLVAAAQAVGENPEVFFEALGRNLPEGIERFAAGGFTVRFNLLNDRDKVIVMQLVETMLSTNIYDEKDLPE